MINLEKYLAALRAIIESGNLKDIDYQKSFTLQNFSSIFSFSF
jgi:hypothetical protein